MATRLQFPEIKAKHKGVSGIYRMTIGEYYYFGSSTDVYRRKYQHQQELRASKHKNKFMQKVFKKYGEPTYEFVMACDRDSLIDLEQKFLNLHHGREFCMNLSNDAIYPRNRIYGEDFKAKMRIAMKGNTNGCGGKGIKRQMPVSFGDNFKKKVSVIDADGNETIYNSATEAGLALNIPKSRISKYCNGAYKSTKSGFIISWGCDN